MNQSQGSPAPVSRPIQAVPPVTLKLTPEEPWDVHVAGHRL